MIESYIDFNANEKVDIAYEWGFYRPEEAYSGFSFPVDKDGNLLSEHSRENFELCKAGKMPHVRDCGIKQVVNRIRLCPCKSLRHYEDVYDARGYFVARVCGKCRAKKLGGYRPEIFQDSQYEYEGCLEPEDY